MYNTNILIPCAGSGQRFKDAGYEMPKPLIPINGKPLIQRVVESLGLNGNYIFCVLKEHEEKWGLASFLVTLRPNCTIILVEKKTEGAVNTCLLAEKYIKDNNPLIISNCDQICKFNSNMFFYYIKKYHGCTVTFENTHPKWSYVQLGNHNFITAVREKYPISNRANVGIYGYQRGKDFVKFAKMMMADKDKRVNNEWYIAPVYNEMIAYGRDIVNLECEEMIACGVPEDLSNAITIIKEREKNVN